MTVNELLIARLRGRIGALTVDLDYALAQLEVAQAELASLKAKPEATAPRRTRAKT